jgi:tubulin--tyrosine ligase
MIHLTNDAVQKKSEDYGKFEGGNKVKINTFYIKFYCLNFHS